MSDKVLGKNEFFHEAMKVFTQSVSRFLNLEKDLRLVQTDDLKQFMRVGVDSPDAMKIKYPYGVYSVTNIGADLESKNFKSVGRNSEGFTTISDMVNASLSKGFLFPVKVSLKVAYFADDFDDAVATAIRMSLASALTKLSTRVTYKGFSWIIDIRLETTDNPMESIEKENEQNTNVYPLSFDFILRTSIGSIKTVSKVNNRGDVEVNVGVRE